MEEQPAGSNGWTSAPVAGAISKTASSGGAYVPRWKRDPNAKPEPYTSSFPGGSAPAPRLKPGEYLAWQIGEKLKVPINHSFLVSVEGEELESARVPSASDHVLGAVTDTNPKQPSGKEVLRAVLNYPGANPPSTEPGTQVIWTRHNLDAVKHSVGNAYPFFTCISPHQSRNQDRSRIFTYSGQYLIESADLATKEEVLEFVKARDQSKGDKPASVWMDKLNSKWLKVMLRKCPEHEQPGNPMGR